jgi:hypothetical protein
MARIAMMKTQHQREPHAAKTRAESRRIVREPDRTAHNHVCEMPNSARAVIGIGSAGGGAVNSGAAARGTYQCGKTTGAALLFRLLRQLRRINGHNDLICLAAKPTFEK